MNKKDFKFSNSYVELTSISDTQLQIVNANDRISLFDDPLYFILPSERIRKLTESEY